MTKYYVHTKTDDDGDHEVHEPTCFRLPKESHREDLGYHGNCDSALEEAEERGYEPADGCWHCADECHTS